MFVKIYNGEREADKLLRERLLQRLGVSDTRSESFLYQDEYDAWRMRQQIVNHMNREEYLQAEELLDEREKLYEHFAQKNSAECENTHKLESLS